MTPTPYDKPIPRPRPVRYRMVQDTAVADRQFHTIRLALTLLYQDEGRVVMDKLIRSACYDACTMHDMRTVERIQDAIHGIAASRGKATQVGPMIACEVLDAISRLWDEYENGDEQPSG